MMYAGANLKAFLTISGVVCLWSIAGCSSDNGSPSPAVASNSNTASAGTPAQVIAPSKSSSPNDSNSQQADKPQVSYGGEESSQSQGGGFDGSGSGFDADSSGDFGMQGGGPGSGSSRPQFGGFGGPDFGGGAPGFAGRSGPGGPPPAGMGGPPRAGMGGPPGGQFGGGLGDNNLDSGDIDFGLEGNGLSGFGPGGFSDGRGNSASLASGFLSTYCLNCHSANQPKGDVRLDTLTDDIAADSKTWKSVVEVLENGSMPPNQARQPDQAIRAQMVSFIRENLGASVEASYLEQAEVAFKKGDEAEALKLFYSHVLTVDDSQAAEVLDNLRYYRPKVSKPEDLVASTDYAATIKPSIKTHLKLAVGIILKADENVTDVRPIGSSQAGGASGFGGSDFGDLGGFGQGSGQGGDGPSDNNKLTTFEDLTGDYGKELVKAFQTRRDEGRFGTLFAKVRIKPSTSFDGAAANSGVGAGMGGAEGDGPADSFGLGGGGGRGPGFGGLRGGGLGGDLGIGGPGMGDMGIGNHGTNRPTKTQPKQPLANGLTYLGKGKINELFKKAVEMGADGIFLFDINSTKNNRTNVVSTDTRLRFMLISGKVVATASKFLNNREIERLAAQNKESDEVQKQVEQVFNRIDQVLVLESVPKMSNSAALKYLHGLVHSDATPLAIMAQARLFQSKEIIDSDQLAMVYQIVLEGNEGISLASGTEADKKLVLETVKSRL